MANHGFLVSNFNCQMVECVEGLKYKRDELQQVINIEEVEKARLTEQINELTDRLAVVQASLRAKNEARCEYDRAISESEQQYSKLIEKTQDAYTNVRRDVCRLQWTNTPPRLATPGKICAPVRPVTPVCCQCRRK